MKKRKSRTKLLANLLMRKPKIVADVFDMGAKNIGVPEIVDAVNEYWDMENRWNVKLTDHYVWSMFHRRAPFQNPDFYREVMEDHKTAVAGRLYSATPSFTLDDDTGEGVKQSLLSDFLAAGVQYKKTLTAITADGFSEEDAIGWLSVTLDAMEKAGVDI